MNTLHYDTSPNTLPGAEKLNTSVFLFNSGTLDCNRYFLEEFEDLNSHYLEHHKLSYGQESSGKKGFYHQKMYSYALNIALD